MVMASAANNNILQFRSLTHVESNPPHFLAAIQVVAHVVAPLRKALINFYFLTNKELGAERKLEWRFLRALGKLVKELTSAPAATAENTQREPFLDNDNASDMPGMSVDPTDFYSILMPTLDHLKQSNNPKDATVALQIMLESIQRCARTLPLTSHLWVALLDQAGLGLMGKASIVGQCPLIEDGEILQRTQKETILEWCPLRLQLEKSLEEGLQNYCGRKPFVYDFDTKPYQFEVRIPLLSPQQFEGVDASCWKTTKSVLYTEVTSFLFLGIDRFCNDKVDESVVIVPTTLDVRKYCDKSVVGTKFELVAGILHDEGDYVALLRNPNVNDKNDDEAWMLMESEEVIPMTETDALDFLQGDGEGAPCGTLVVYRRCDDGSKLKSLLSDIIISQISGSLDSASDDFYYEEEVIDD
jgi:hypothetical protein